MTVYWTIPVWMWPLLLFVAAGAVFWTRRTYGQTHPAVRPSLLRLLLFLRTTALLLLLLAIAGPVISFVQTKHEPPEILVLFEDSGSMSLADAGPGNISRWQWALDGIRAAGDAFSQAGVDVNFSLIRGNGLRPGQEFTLADANISLPSAHGTDLERFIATEVQGKSRISAATILFSDGQQTVAANGGEGTGLKFGISENPLFVVGVGDARGAADRLITDLRYPDMAYAGDDVVVQLAIAHRFTEAMELPEMVVRLMGKEGELARKVIAPETSVQVLELAFIPEEEGVHTYSLEVSPLDNERFRANNKVSLVIDVQKSRARVLLLSEFPGWDVRFLAQAAQLESRVDLQVVYAGASGLVIADSLTVWKKPQSSVGWLQWDAVILTAWSGKLARLDWDSLAEAVDQGLGLLVMPGGAINRPKILPLPVMPLALQKVLPIEASSSWVWQRGTYFLSAERDLQGHPVLAGVAVDAAGAQGFERNLTLDDMPPLPGVVGVVPGQEAMVLIAGVQRAGGHAPARVPLLVVGRHGVGPVGWFGGRRLWETAFWTEGTQEAALDNFSGQPVVRILRNLLVWIASGAQENGLAFTGHRSIFQAGEGISVAAQWRDMRGKPLWGKSMYLLLDQETGELGAGARSFSFGTMDPQTGVAKVDLPALRPGHYSVQLLGAGDPPVSGPRGELTVLDHSVEDTQVRLDRRSLVQFASRHGGRFHELADDNSVDELVEELLAVSFEETESVKRYRYDLWAGWPFLVLISALLGYEWFLRRRHGML